MSRFYETSTDSHTPTKILAVYPSLSNSTSSSTILPSSSYPSPSPTYSDAGNNFHLPLSTSLHHHPPPLGESVGYVGGILDSPIMRSDAYKSAAPPTLLPPAATPLAYESVYGGTSPPSPSLFFPQMEEDSFYYPLTGDFSDHSDSSDAPSPPFFPFTPSSQSSCSTLQSPPPLSPVSTQSPEWSLFSSYGNSLPRDLDFDALPLPFGDSEGGVIFQDRLGQTDSKSPKRASSLLSNQWRYYNNCPHHDDGYPLFCPESPKPLLQRLDPIDIEDTALPPLPFVFHRPYGEDNEVAERQENNDYQETPETKSRQRKAELLSPHPPDTISRSFFPLMRRSSVPELEGDSMDVDLPDIFEDAPPPSPSGRSYAALPDDNDTTGYSTQYPLSDDMDILDSPTLSLLSLPGADIDEELLPQDSAVARPASQIKSSPYANRLLVLDDDTSSQQDNQRSPSPEPCALLEITHLRPEMQNDEEMRKVFGLLKRAKERERAAKQLEAVVEREERVARSIGNDSNGSGTVNALMDARKRTKKWKNKVREVAILLRLNLAQRGLQVLQDEFGGVTLEPTSASSSPPVDVSRLDENAMEVEQVEESRTSSGNSLPSKKKPPIRSPQHLLVRMLLDRHEPKYNANLRAGLPTSKKGPSPLRRGLVTAGEMENDDVLKHNNTSSGAKDSRFSKYSDSISPFNPNHRPQNAILDSICSGDRLPSMDWN